MKTVPTGFTLNSREDIPILDLINLTRPTYQQAFLRGVWQETLSDEVVNLRLVKNFSHDFEGYWLVDQQNGILTSASWFEFISGPRLEMERGPQLSHFSDNIIDTEDISEMVWYTETFTHPDYWHRGFAKLLMEQNFIDLQNRAKTVGKILVLVRMRDDNKNILAISQGLGFIKTGIRLPSSTDPTNPAKYHEYWYKIVK